MTSQRVERTWIHTGGSGVNGLSKENRHLYKTVQINVYQKVEVARLHTKNSVGCT